MARTSRSDEHYDRIQMGFHWATALFIVLALCFVWSSSLVPKGPLQGALFFTHRSCGLTVFVLTALRLAWRLTHTVPPPPTSVPVWQQRAGTTLHWLLYALFLLLPIGGFIASAAGGHVVTYFFLFDLPLLPENKPLAHLAGDIHATAQWAVYSLILLHTAAALYHHFVVRDGVLRRMLPGN